MSLRISRLSNHKLDGSRKYFLDSNVWIFTLGAIVNPNPRETAYLSFAENLLQHEIKIQTHTLVFSEVFNALLRNAFDDFKSQLKANALDEAARKKIEGYSLKKHFRGTTEYQTALERIKSDVQAYIPSLEFLDKSYDLDFEYISKSLTASSDFNDYLYYEMALDLGLTIVTDDGDFNFSGIEILTENHWSLKNSQS
ncbi:PIN domain-containing protein [Algoriphagus boseongensis]|uniref:PIN domain-containing protein n=1 Tax=Algoriphagus boseongensis TaxID=1442587 RepID=A0A4R6T7N1_9BACT|nr:PIN domain-containing protein [Algoriphagus boseongensis]TDQ16897.1 PIN domain-containing protein [Algoriphagus boseongensis]